MHARIIPTLRYDDAPAAIEWLCRAFGFTPHLVVHGAGGSIAHAQLSLGGAMIMLGSSGSGEFDEWQKTPHALGGRVTQSPYVVIDAVDDHYRGALTAGAAIVLGPADQDHGGRLYSCGDPEGHLWQFGSYDPWAPPA